MRDARPRPTCARCSAPLVEISFSQGGATVNMQSCARCHRRSWYRDEEAVDLAEVLDSVATKRPRERPAADG